MKIINLTPHPVILLDEDGDVVRRWDKPAEDVPLPRLVEESTPDPLTGEVGVPVVRKAFGRCENLPDPKDGIFFIVSGLIAQALRRPDLLVPNTVRDEEGKIVGCDSFSRILEKGFQEPKKGSRQEYLVELLEKMLLPKWGGKDYPLLDIAARHDHPLTPKECQEAGVTPETPVRIISGGYNGKRPLYAMRGAKGWVLANGTYFGRNSCFELGLPGDLESLVKRLPATEQARLKFLE